MANPKYKAQESYRKVLKAEVLLRYGCKCAICGMDDPRFLTVDHINGLTESDTLHERSGYRLYLKLRREGFPPGYQILCSYCNRMKQ